jgi:two-component system chemotaxis response regulator CheB
MPGHDIMVVGASAGGLEALKLLVSGLPQDFRAALFVVQHIAPEAVSVLPAILSRAGPLPAAHADNGQAIEPGHIYVAPPDHHLLVEPWHIRLTRGPKENRFRPAVDVLCRSAAYAYGPRAVGVILTGSLDDGTAGLWAIKDRGGIAVVQDPEEALFPSMPKSALRHVAVDYCLPLADIAPLLVRLSAIPAPEEGGSPVSERLDIEARIAKEANALEIGVMRLGTLSPYTCPDCHGVLMQIEEGGLLRFRCHTGHAFSVSNLLAEVSESIEQALWSTLRGMEESLLLLQHLARHTRVGGEGATADLLETKAREVTQRVALIRQAVIGHEKLSEENFHPNAP